MTGPTLTFLVIDDEPQIRRVVRNALLAADFGTKEERDAPQVRVLEACTGQEGGDIAASQLPDLIILDLGLPDQPGLTVCREIRRWTQSPVIVLSARHEDTEKAALLDAGADDYVTKPFSTVEMLARVRAQLRRSRQVSDAMAPSERVVLGDITVDLTLRRVEKKGELVHLTPTEWVLLRTFLEHPRKTMTHRQLFTAVWGNSEGDAQQYLRVYVGHLRRKVEADPMRPRFLRTEAGVGYRFEPEPGPEA